MAQIPPCLQAGLIQREAYGVRLACHGLPVLWSTGQGAFGLESAGKPGALHTLRAVMLPFGVREPR